MQQQWQEMQERVKALEGEVAKLRKLLLGALLFAGLPYLLAAKSAMQALPVVRAKRFEVVMDDKVVATLKGVQLRGTKALGIYGENGEPVASLFATSDGGKLAIYNKEGKVVALLGSDPDGGSLSIRNKEGKLVVVLGTIPNGGSLDILNKEGEEVVWLRATPYGGKLGIYNKEGKPVVVLGADPYGGILGLFSLDGRTLFSAP